MFRFVQSERYGAYRKTHARANLDRKRPRIVAQPYLQLRLARKQHAIEDESFIADRVECSHLGSDLFALLRLHASRRRLLAVAHRNLRTLAGLQPQGP